MEVQIPKEYLGDSIEGKKSLNELIYAGCSGLNV